MVDKKKISTYINEKDYIKRIKNRIFMYYAIVLSVFFFITLCTLYYSSFVLKNNIENQYSRQETKYKRVVNVLYGEFFNKLDINSRLFLNELNRVQVDPHDIANIKENIVSDKNDFHLKKSRVDKINSVYANDTLVYGHVNNIEDDARIKEVTRIVKMRNIMKLIYQSLDNQSSVTYISKDNFIVSYPNNFNKTTSSQTISSLPQFTQAKNNESHLETSYWVLNPTYSFQKYSWAYCTPVYDGKELKGSLCLNLSKNVLLSPMSLLAKLWGNEYMAFVTNEQGWILAESSYEFINQGARPIESYLENKRYASLVLGSIRNPNKETTFHNYSASTSSTNNNQYYITLLHDKSYISNHFKIYSYFIEFSFLLFALLFLFLAFITRYKVVDAILIILYYIEDASNVYKADTFTSIEKSKLLDAPWVDYLSHVNDTFAVKYLDDTKLEADNLEKLIVKGRVKDLKARLNSLILLEEKEVAVILLSLENVETLEYLFGLEGIREVQVNLMAIIKDLVGLENIEIYNYQKDNLYIILKNISMISQLEEVLIKLEESLNVSQNIMGITFSPNVVMGGTITKSSMTSEDILIAVNHIWNYAKTLSRVWYMHDFRMTTEINKYMLIKREIDKVNKLEQFANYYEAQTNLQTGKIQGFKVHLFWHNAERGTVSIDDLIDSDKKLEIYTKTVDWSINMALKDLRYINERLGLNESEISMSFDYPARIIHDVYNLRKISKAVVDKNLSLKSLELRIDYKTLTSMLPEVATELRAMVMRGLKLSIRNVALAGNSVQLLNMYNPNSFLLDEVSLRNIASDKVKQKIIKNYIETSNFLKVNVIATNMKIKRDYTVLKELGIAMIEGELIAPPLPLVDLFSVIDTENLQVKSDLDT